MSQDSGAWLLVRQRSSAAESRHHAALPVPRQACVGLARAVLAGGDDAGRWLALAGDDEAVAGWLASASGSPDGRTRSLLQRLADDLVVGAAPPGTPGGGTHATSVASAEAILLSDAVARMQEQERLSSRFGDSLQAARLEAARELAYGAGHEINNPLANIATRAQSLLLEERDPERRRRLATIVDQSFRARDMIGGLMLFARPPKPNVEAAAVGEIIEAVIGSTRSQASARGVRVEHAPSHAFFEVAVDRSQVEEALRAIVINAIEAVADGGRVSVAARPVDDGAEWCEVAIVDEGCGMDDATIRRAYDPFFSGREAGRGAGLGLSKAWRFIDGSGGTVVITSRPGAGTTVVVRLPAAGAGRVAPGFLV